MVGRNTTAIQPISTGPTRVDSARDIVLVRSKNRNNSANTPKRGLNLYRLNSAKNTTTIRPVTLHRSGGSSLTEVVSFFGSRERRVRPAASKRGLNLYRLNSAKNTTTIRPVTSTGAKRHVETSNLRTRLKNRKYRPRRSRGSSCCAETTENPGQCHSFLAPLFSSLAPLFSSPGNCGFHLCFF